ncbi:hypothetical protein FRIG_06190 [Frigoribacterium faeni]|uniref:hypothetical protein n=1 Tax=Frigoribacterium faeni TaxID=145483 RepID=UPI001FAB874C|nr:hypothetical protein [Frigoribacterium faeni]MCJ0700723.1 hypothetical protein [Frigoribacterium faeni]
MTPLGARARGGSVLGVALPGRPLVGLLAGLLSPCLLYTSPSPRDGKKKKNRRTTQ